MKANESRVWNPEAASITLRNWAFASSFLPWLFKEKGGRCDPAKVNSSVKSSSVQKSVQKIPKSVFLFDDRIEVLSYGSLPFNMSEEDFYAGKSRPVNRSLFETFALSSLAEQSGHGVPLIVDRCGKKASIFLPARSSSRFLSRSSPSRSRCSAISPQKGRRGATSRTKCSSFFSSKAPPRCGNAPRVSASANPTSRKPSNPFACKGNSSVMVPARAGLGSCRRRILRRFLPPTFAEGHNRGILNVIASFSRRDEDDVAPLFEAEGMSTFLGKDDASVLLAFQGHRHNESPCQVSSFLLVGPTSWKRNRFFARFRFA